MCGIMGFVGKPKDKKVGDLSYQLASKLLAETVTRGSHATGVYVLQPPKDEGGKIPVFIYKLDAPSTQFVRTPTWKQEMRKQGDPFLLLGHCRFYTHGSPQDHINNHPHFTDDKRLALIHNGVISGYTGLKDTYKVKGECDSEVLLRIIESEADVVEGIKKVFRVVTSGSMACLVSKYDPATKKAYLYAFRNDGNPIQVVDLREEWGQLFFASTKDIAEKAMKNSGMPKEVQKADIKELPAFTILKVDADTLETETIEVEKPKSDFTYSAGTSRAWRGYNRSAAGGTSGVSTGTPAKIRQLIDTIMESVTEIDENLTLGKKMELTDTELEEVLKDVAWELEKVTNPAVTTGAGSTVTVQDDEAYD